MIFFPLRYLSRGGGSFMSWERAKERKKLVVSSRRGRKGRKEVELSSLGNPDKEAGHPLPL